MAIALSITFFRGSAPVYTTQFTDGLELGRCTDGEPRPISVVRRADSFPRLVAFAETHFSRRHCTITVCPGPQVRVIVENHSSNPIRFQSPPEVLQGKKSSQPLDLPVRIWFPEHNPSVRKWDRVATIELARGGKPLSATDTGLIPTATDKAATLAGSEIGSKTDHVEKSRPGSGAGGDGGGPPPAAPSPLLSADAGGPGQLAFDRDTFEALLRGLAAIGQTDNVHEHITRTAELVFPKAAAGLLAADGRPIVHPTGMTVPDDPILRQLGRPPAAFYLLGTQLPERFVGPDAIRPEAVLFVPIFNAARRQTHTLYVAQLATAGGVSPAAAGDRMKLLGTLLETVLSVEVEAFERKREQIKLLKAFLPTKFAAEVLRDPAQIAKYKSGLSAEVSVLFCDIRGSTAIAASADVSRAVIDDWRAAVRELIKGRIREADGDVFDTKGDSVAAVWYTIGGSVAECAGRACRAAAGILAGVRGLDAEWKPRLGGAATAVGVGVATGPARLSLGEGDIFRKFGPDGHVVNLASRIEGATRHLSVPALVCDETAARAPTGDGAFTLRQIMAQVLLAGVPDPQTLYMLTPGRETATPVLVLPGK